MKQISLVLLSLISISLLLKDVSSSPTKSLGPDEIKQIYKELKTKLENSLIKLNEMKNLPNKISNRINANVEEALGLTSQLSENCRLQAQLKLNSTRDKFQHDVDECEFIRGMLDNIQILIEDGEELVEGLVWSVIGSIKNELSCLNSSHKIECFAAKTVNASTEIALDSWRVAKFVWQIGEFEFRTLKLVWSCFTEDILVSKIHSTVLESYKCNQLESYTKNNAVVNGENKASKEKH